MNVSDVPLLSWNGEFSPKASLHWPYESLENMRANYARMVLVFSFVEALAMHMGCKIPD